MGQDLSRGLLIEEQWSVLFTWVYEGERGRCPWLAQRPGDPLPAPWSSQPSGRRKSPGPGLAVMQ